MSGPDALSGNGALVCAAALAIIVTIALKTLPATFLNGDNLPRVFRKWLDFVPVAVMAALVGPDVFIYNGSFDLSPASNLFLLVSIPTLLVAYLSRNYFLTIAVGIGLIILARYYGFA